MPLSRRLYRSILQQIHQFRKDGIPIVGLAGTSNDPVLQQLPVVVDTDVVSHVRAAFRHPPSQLSTQHGFAILRALSAQHHTLVTVEEHTRDALAAWHVFFTAPPTPSSPHQPTANHAGIGHKAAPSSSHHADQPFQLAAGIECACSLVRQLYQDTQLEGLDDGDAEGLQGHANNSDDQVSKEHTQVLAALNPSAGGSLSAALDCMSAHIRAQHPDLFHTDHSLVQQQQPHLNHELIISALQQYLYGTLKLRHEPIEWLYDGIHPLLPEAALRLRKVAPFTMSLLACMVASRLGVPCMPLRAHPLSSAHPHANNPAPAAELPEGLALHLSKRAAPFITSDSWLLAVLQPSHAPVTSSSTATSPEPPPAHSSQAGPDSWLPGGPFLDTSCRGGLLITGTEQLLSRYPDALSQAALSTGAGSQLVLLCGEWVRGVMVAHQRRGESDLVAHWLVQVLALNPHAPEWDMMMQG